MHLESILLCHKTVSISSDQFYYIIVNHMDVVAMIFQSKARSSSQKQAFLFTCIETFRAECLPSIVVAKKSWY